MLGPVSLGMAAVSAFAQHPIQTARGIFQAFCVATAASWIGFGAWGLYLAAKKGEPQAERVYNTCGTASAGTAAMAGAHTPTPGTAGPGLGSTAEPAQGPASTTAGDMADTSGGVDNWITDGLLYAGLEDSDYNHQSMYALIMGESSGNDLNVQDCTPPNNDENCDPALHPGAGGFTDNRARGLCQITPERWAQFAPAELQPASDWIFKPRANVAVSAIYQKKQYQGLVGHSGY